MFIKWKMDYEIYKKKIKYYKIDITSETHNITQININIHIWILQHNIVLTHKYILKREQS